MQASIRFRHKLLNAHILRELSPNLLTNTTQTKNKMESLAMKEAAKANLMRSEAELEIEKVRPPPSTHPYTRLITEHRHAQRKQRSSKTSGRPSSSSANRSISASSITTRGSPRTRL